MQAWIEASTKGAVLLFTASEIETKTMEMGISPGAAGLLGGMGGGIAQAYTTMGACTLSHLLSNTHMLFDYMMQINYWLPWLLDGSNNLRQAFAHA